MELKKLLLVAAISLLLVGQTRGIFSIESTFKLALDILNNILSFSARLFGRNVFKINNIRDIESEYDFIIVGSGSAGSVIANRLSEIPDWKILLLEVGKPETSFSRVPLFAPLMQWTDYNWDYRTEPVDNFCLAMEDRICAWPRGRALGGSTVLNYMIYTRGNHHDYDRWASLGNPGWSNKEVLPYFMKSENVALEHFDEDFHGTEGYLGVGDVFSSKITDAFLDGAVEMGYRILDYNGLDQNGFSKMQATVQKGRRHSVARAFLSPIGDRENLHILTEARVTKVLINEHIKRAKGVEFVHRGRKYSIAAKREVILSAGAFNSPQLLMLSGIGPRKHLEELGIPILQDLPVGQNLQDHISYVGLVFLINELIEKASDVANPAKILNWYKTGKGPLASLAGIEAIGYINTNSSKDFGLDYPDIELIFVGGGALQTDMGLFNRRFQKITDEDYRRAFGPSEGIPSWTVFPMLLHPKSKGQMKLRSRNPSDHPKFYPNFFTDPSGDDKRTLIASINFIIALSKTQALQKYNSTLSPVPVPGCENLKFLSDEYWSCALERFTVTLHHQVGTCKMGPVGDEEAVVGADLKVHGVEGLRVADTSVIPFALSAHTNAPSIMIGEKTSDIIKKDYGKL